VVWAGGGLFGKEPDFLGVWDVVRWIGLGWVGGDGWAYGAVGPSWVVR
jgi:hypothetical protein